MATSVTTNLLYFSLGTLVLLSLAQFGYGESQQGSQRQCQIEKLTAQEPHKRVQSEAGFIDEYYDKNNEQFECTGATAFRTTVQPGGLFLPRFFNSPVLGYVLQGSGIFGAVIPGCPETFQSFQQSKQHQEGKEGEKRLKDEHQRVQRFREGDIVAMPAGVAHWCYNDGESPLVIINLMDISNNANQLDDKPMEFLLAGRERGGSQSVTSILDGFEMHNLADVMGIPTELVKKVQTPTDDNRGTIIKVRGELQVLRPSRSDESEEEEKEISNGLEQTVCNMRLKQNIRDPAIAFVYNPKAGRIADLNSQNLPILKSLGLSAEWGSLKKNAIHGPYWTVNAHTLMYVTRGSCRCQIVDNHGKSLFDGDLHQDQLLIVPQNFAVLKQTRSDDDFQWVSFMTNDNVMVNQIAGRGSALKSMPVDVIMNSYRISKEEARMVKENRGEEIGLFSPRSSQGASA